jgi:hypothetical protein
MWPYYLILDLTELKVWLHSTRGVKSNRTPWILYATKTLQERFRRHTQVYCLSNWINIPSFRRSFRSRLADSICVQLKWWRWWRKIKRRIDIADSVSWMQENGSPSFRLLCVAVAYLVGGVVVNKFVRKQEGVTELLPNYGFWVGLPSLVKVSPTLTHFATHLLTIFNRMGSSSLWAR